MLKDYNEFVGNERKRIFEEKILNWKSKNEILQLYESGVSPLQIARLFDHEIGMFAFANELSVFEAADGTKKAVKPFNRGLNIANFSCRLKSIVSYTKDHLKIHLKQPQWKKIRFNHLDKSEDEVFEIAQDQLKEWARATQNKRKKSGAYIKQYTNEYWIEKGMTQEESKDAIEKYKKSISPYCIDFWLKKGLNVNEAKKQIVNLARNRGAKGLSSLSKSCVSLLEKRIFDLLNNKDLEQQIFIGPYSYDIGSRKLKKLIEVNGTYWHADPRVYSADDVIIAEKRAKEIWLKDLEKVSYAKKYGYDVFCVWEIDFCKNPDLTLKLINDFLEK